jgi:hypothetical protein
MIWQQHEIILENAVKTKRLKFVFESMSPHVPVSLFGIAVYENIR